MSNPQQGGHGVAAAFPMSLHAFDPDKNESAAFFCLGTRSQWQTFLAKDLCKQPWKDAVAPLPPGGRQPRTLKHPVSYYDVEMATPSTARVITTRAVGTEFQTEKRSWVQVRPLSRSCDDVCALFWENTFCWGECLVPGGGGEVTSGWLRLDFRNGGPRHHFPWARLPASERPECRVGQALAKLTCK